MKNNLLKSTKLWTGLVLFIFTIFYTTSLVLAGSLFPQDFPTPTMYTLSDIYTKLTTNEDADDPENKEFEPLNEPEETFVTLSNIYDAIPDIESSKIAIGATYLGVEGTLMANMFNGTGTKDPGGNAKDWVGGTQKYGGVEDWNGDGAGTPKGQHIPGNAYKGIWTKCNIDNAYCDTEDDGADYKDELTGLIWSKTLSNIDYSFDGSNGTMSWFKANNCTGIGGNDCIKLEEANKTGCEVHSNWYVPHQKQLMQAYINGSYAVLEETRLTSAQAKEYWSATTASYNLANGFAVKLSQGTVSGKGKIQLAAVRCVYDDTIQ